MSLFIKSNEYYKRYFDVIPENFKQKFNIKINYDARFLIIQNPVWINVDFTNKFVIVFYKNILIIENAELKITINDNKGFEKFTIIVM